MMTFKMAIENVAGAHGLRASFAPGPLSGQVSSSLYTSASPFKGGGSVFYGPESEIELSRPAYYFIVGVIRHTKGTCLLINPLVDSCKRLVTGYETPRYIMWTIGNRSALVHVSSVWGVGTRVELRNPDLAANSYLRVAVLLAAGLEGIRGELMSSVSTGSSIYDTTPNGR